MYLVYCHTNKVNGKKYFGITSSSIEKRAGSRGCMYKSSPYFYSAIKKYGWDNFDHEVVKDGLTVEDASELERKLIADNNTMDKQFGYNCHIGGFPTTEECNKFCDTDRVSKIKNTLREQRADPEVRAAMRERMLKHWADNREFRLSRMSDKAGKPKIRAFVEELDMWFNCKADCARYLGIPKGNLSTARAIRKGMQTVRNVTVNDRVYDKLTIRYYKTNVDVKESELLEAPPSEVEGNQQPSCTETERRCTEGSETIPQGSRASS